MLPRPTAFTTGCASSGEANWPRNNADVSIPSARVRAAGSTEATTHPFITGFCRPMPTPVMSMPSAAIQIPPARPSTTSPAA